MSNTLLQPAAFLVMLYAGIWVGLAYDVLRLPRRLWRSKVLHVLADVLFALLALLLTAGGLLIASGGVIRIYLLAGLFVGICLEQWSISHLFFHIIYALRDHIK